MICHDRKPCAAPKSELRRAMREPPGSAPKVTKPGGPRIASRSPTLWMFQARHDSPSGIAVHLEARLGRWDLGGRSQRPIARLPP